jgi:hypothetical protein
MKDSFYNPSAQRTANPALAAFIDDIATVQICPKPAIKEYK